MSAASIYKSVDDKKQSLAICQLSTKEKEKRIRSLKC